LRRQYINFVLKKLKTETMVGSNEKNINKFSKFLEFPPPDSELDVCDTDMEIVLL